jgi:hypothetical protein
MSTNSIPIQLELMAYVLEVVLKQYGRKCLQN